MVTHGSTTCTLLEAQDDANANYYANTVQCSKFTTPKQDPAKQYTHQSPPT